MALAFLAAIGFAAWEWPSLRAKREVRRALAAGRYRDAWTIADRWLRDRPRSAEAHYLRAKAAIALGRKRDIYAGLKEAQAAWLSRGTARGVTRACSTPSTGGRERLAPSSLGPLPSHTSPTPCSTRPWRGSTWRHTTIPTPARSSIVGPPTHRTTPGPLCWHAAVHRRSDAEPEVIIEDYREALRRDTDNAEARLGLAEQLEQAHRNREAADAYAAYLALRPDDPAGHLGAGRNAADSGDDDAGQVHLDRVLNLDPENAVAHLERAKISLRRGANETALVHLDRAVALAPFDPVAHYQRSLALKRLGRRTEAEVANRTFHASRRTVANSTSSRKTSPCRLRTHVCKARSPAGCSATATTPKPFSGPVRSSPTHLDTRRLASSSPTITTASASPNRPKFIANR